MNGAFKVNCVDHCATPLVLHATMKSHKGGESTNVARFTDSFSQPLGESRQQDILDRGTKTKRKMLVNLALKHISLPY